jgi:hypothetical protein
MRHIFRSIGWTFGGLVGLGLSAAQGQQPLPAYYYPAPGYYATTRGTVRIPTAGYYLNVPLNAVPAPGLSTVPPRSVSSNPAQGYSGSGYPDRSTIPYSSGRDVATASYTGEPDPNWQFRQ